MVCGERAWGQGAGPATGHTTLHPGCSLCSQHFLHIRQSPPPGLCSVSPTQAHCGLDWGGERDFPKVTQKVRKTT